MTLFDKWYSHYPRKKGKGQARAKWNQLNFDETMTDTLIASLKLQIEEVRIRKQRGLFVPEWKYPSTWLNGECWEDEVDLEIGKDIMEIAQDKGIEARPGESMDQYKQRIQRTRH